MARSIRAKIFGITMHRPPVYADERFDCQGLSMLPKKGKTFISTAFGTANSSGE